MATAAASMTGAQFDALPYEEGRQWELVEGELIAVPSPTGRHQDVVFLLQSAIRSHLKDYPMSALVYADVEFALTQDDRVRPDVLVLLGANAEAFDKDKVPVPGAPDIAIEVISPSERAAESQAKVRRYLHCGATEVWQIYPKSRHAELHALQSTRIVEGPGSLTTPLLPGLAIPLVSLFD
jgi:Uma2 family endonuclease